MENIAKKSLDDAIVTPALQDENGDLAPPLLRWIEATAGVRVRAATKQGRGRPAWFLDAETADGAAHRLYLRCDRGIAAGINRYYPLQREANLLFALSNTDVPVAKTHGYNAEYRALLQDCVEGQVRFHHIADSDERERVGNDFMRALARLHALRPQDLDLPADEFHVPTTAADHALHDLALWGRTHYDSIEEPEPFMTFALGWLKRRVPDRVLGTVIVQGDTGPGQFIFRDGKVAAIVDWEYAHWGCPMEDLAEIRQRELLYPFGDMMARFRVYEEASGTPLDLDLIRYYTVRSLINTPLALIGPELTRPQSHADIAERLAWNALFLRVTAEALAEAENIDLSGDQIVLPAPPATDRTARLFDVVLDDLQREHLPQLEDEYAHHRLRSTTFLFTHLRQQHRIGGLLDEQDLDDMTRLLGVRPSCVLEGKHRLDRMVREVGAERDAELIRYFYRYARRQELVLGDAALSQGDMGKAARLQLLPR